MPTVEFLNVSKKVQCGQYANLRKTALMHDVPVYAGINEKLNCGGHGLCGTCVVEVVEGQENLSPRTGLERFKLKGEPENRRLSCQCEVLGDLCVITSPALD